MLCGRVLRVPPSLLKGECRTNSIDHPLLVDHVLNESDFIGDLSLTRAKWLSVAKRSAQCNTA